MQNILALNLNFTLIFISKIMCWKNYDDFNVNELERIFYFTSCNTFSHFKLVLWYKSHIKIDNKSVYFQRFSMKNINFVTHLFQFNGTIKNWNNPKTEFALWSKDHFSGLQLVSSLQEIWNNCLKQKSENTSLLVFEDHHLIRGLRITILEKSNFQRVVLCVNFWNRWSTYLTKIF